MAASDHHAGNNEGGERRLGPSLRPGGGGRGLAVAPSLRGDASLESFNSYRKRDRVNERQREPGDHGALGGGAGGGGRMTTGANMIG